MKATRRSRTKKIYGNVLTMLLAGEDTTANTMAWMMHFMIEHPEVQARMQAEAGQVVGDAGMLSQLADAERLNYIEAVTHETMRLKPVAPILFLESNEDVEIGGVAVPKETALLLLTLHGGLQDTTLARRTSSGRNAGSKQHRLQAALTMRRPSFPLGRVRVSVRVVNWRWWRSRRSWPCCAPRLRSRRPNSRSRSERFFRSR